MFIIILFQSADRKQQKLFCTDWKLGLNSVKGIERESERERKPEIKRNGQV